MKSKGCLTGYDPVPSESQSDVQSHYTIGTKRQLLSPEGASVELCQTTITFFENTVALQRIQSVYS